MVAESGWFAARPSGTESIYKIYAESFRGADHLRRILEEAQAIVSDTLAATPEPGRNISEQNHVSYPLYNLLPREIEGFDPLAELALNLRWSWNHATDKVWRNLIPSCGRSPITPGWSVDSLARPDRAHVGRSRFSQKR